MITDCKLIVTTPEGAENKMTFIEVGISIKIIFNRHDLKPENDLLFLSCLCATNVTLKCSGKRLQNLSISRFLGCLKEHLHKDTTFKRCLIFWIVCSLNVDAVHSAFLNLISILFAICSD